MSDIIIYATATHKRSENLGYCCISTQNNGKAKPVLMQEKFESSTNVETYLKTLSLAIKNLPKSNEDILIYTDLAVIQKLKDGTVDQWAENHWIHNKKEVKHADLWEELYLLTMEHEIHFQTSNVDDGIMEDLTKTLSHWIKTGKSTSRKAAHTETPEKVKAEPSRRKKVVAKKPVAVVPEKLTEDVPKKIPEKANKTKKEKKVPVNNTLFTESKTAEVLKSMATAEKTESVKNSISVDSKLYHECDTLFADLGLDVNIAVTMFLKHSLRKQGLTLDLKLGQENL